MRIRLSVLCVMISATGWLSAAGAQDDLAYWQELAKRKLAGFEVTAVAPSPIEGLVELRGTSPRGPQVLYATGDGRYVLAGLLWDVERSVNLTAGVLQAMRRQALERVDLGSAVIHYPASSEGTSRGTLLYFLDPDCPYCRKFHAELPKLTASGIPVSIVLYPNRRLHPQAVATSHAIWCSEDRRAALDRWMSEQSMPVPASDGCRAPLETARLMAETAGVQGTPFFVFPDGRRLQGYRSAEELIAMWRAQKP